MKKIVVSVIMGLFVAIMLSGLSGCGDSSSSSGNLTPVGTVVNLSKFAGTFMGLPNSVVLNFRSLNGILFFRIGVFLRLPPLRLTAYRGNCNRYVRGYDYELVVCLACRQLSLKPVPPGSIEKPVSVNIVRAVGFRLGVVQHDDLERDVRPRHEAVTGEVASPGGVDQVEPVTDRAGGCIEKFLHPFGYRHPVTVPVSRDGRRSRVTSGIDNVAVRS